MTEPVLLNERRGPVALLTLNRPEARNALNTELLEALTDAVEQSGRDGAVRAVVITGAGTSFCAGADLLDLAALRDATQAENLEDGRRFQHLFRTLSTCPKPLVGAVNGPALAGGCGLATCCDILLASTDATFGYPEVKVGFVAAMVLVFLARQLGERRARELLLTAAPIGADQAHTWGLVHHVMPAEALVEEAVAHARQLAAGAPGALALTKELLWRTSGLPMEQALEMAAMANVHARTSPDMREGVTAFLEKRRPAWRHE